MDNAVTCTMWLEIWTSTYRGLAILISFNYHLPYFKLPPCPCLGRLYFLCNSPRLRRQSRPVCVIRHQDLNWLVRGKIYRGNKIKINLWSGGTRAGSLAHADSMNLNCKCKIFTLQSGSLMSMKTHNFNYTQMVSEGYKHVDWNRERTSQWMY